jgi:FMN-dependent NADH-azoreductase
MRMAQLLHLDTSARRASLSRRLGNAFARAWGEVDTVGGYRYRDLVASPVPPIGEAWTEICDYLMANQITGIDKLATGARTPAQREAWSIVAPLLDELAAADVVLIGTPMYNYSVPASLKAWIDQVTFPHVSLAGRRVVVASARGGTYAPSTPKEPFDHQTRYLRDFFRGHFGIDEVTVITAELSNAIVDPWLAGQRARHAASLAAALDEARRLGAALAREMMTTAGERSGG